MAKKLMMLVAAVAAAFGAWAETETVGGYIWTYRINGETAEIYKGSSSPAISPSPTGAMTIPSTLGGKTVTSIGSYAFYNCSGLTSVTIPNTVTNIGSYAFCYCRGLTSVTIPDSVTSFEDWAFSGCSGLADDEGFVIVRNVLYDYSGVGGALVIPDSVTSIGDAAFSGCSGLTSVTIPSSVTSIGEAAFYGCSGLTSVTIPNSVTSIVSSAFRGCSGLTSVTMPSSVTFLHAGEGPRGFVGVFEGCEKLWTKMYMTLANISAAGGTGGGSPSVVTTIVQQVESPYALTDSAADRAIAAVTVDSDCAIDSFVLKDGEVYDSVLYISNTADSSVKLTLPSGFVYKTYKGTKPLEIPAKSQCMLSITRVADKTFLVSREELEDVQ